jgi:hypothetical protein
MWKDVLMFDSIFGFTFFGFIIAVCRKAGGDSSIIAI